MIEKLPKGVLDWKINAYYLFMRVCGMGYDLMWAYRRLSGLIGETIRDGVQIIEFEIFGGLFLLRVPPHPLPYTHQ